MLSPHMIADDRNEMEAQKATGLAPPTSGDAALAAPCLRWEPHVSDGAELPVVPGFP